MNISSKYLLLSAALIGITASIFLGWSFYDKETKAIELDFRKDVDDKAAALEREILLNLEALYSIKGLFDSSDDVSSTKFNKIARSIFVRHKYIQALEWVQKVLNSEREAYEKKRHEEYPDFEITEQAKQGSMIRAHERDIYFPVYYVEPLTGNEAAFGFDLASSPKRLKTLEMSRDLGTALATASIMLVQEASNQKGFLTFMPIYQGQPATVGKRRERLRGFVLGVFRIGDMFRSAVKRTAAQLRE